MSVAKTRKRIDWRQIGIAFAVSIPCLTVGFGLSAGLQALGLRVPYFTVIVVGMWVMEATRTPFSRLFGETTRPPNVPYLIGLGLSQVIVLVAINA